MGKRVSVDRAKKICQGLNCGVLHQQKLRANDTEIGGKLRECGVLIPVKKIDQRKGHNPW